MQWGHVGDSRLYYFKNGRIVKRTLDHSVPQMLVAAGEIDEKEIRHHPDRNRLVRVMGMEWDEPKYQVSEPMPEEPGQAFLLCSDGFWENIEEEQIIEFVLADQIEKLIQLGRGDSFGAGLRYTRQRAEVSNIAL